MEQNLKLLNKISFKAKLCIFASYLVIFISIILIIVGYAAYKKPFDQNPFYFVAIVLLVLSIISIYLFSFFWKKKALNVVKNIEVFGSDFLNDLEKIYLGPLGCWNRISQKINVIFVNLNNLSNDQKATLDNFSSSETNKKNENLLDSQRLYVRHFVKEDVNKVFQYRNDENCFKYQSYSCFSQPDLLNMFKENEIKNLYSETGNFALISKENNELVGEIFVSNKKDTKEYFIGFTIIPKFQRKGYAFEIVSELLVKMATSLTNYVFVCTVYEKNIKSLNLVKKLEFKKSGSFNGEKGKVLVYKKSYN
ncbi:MAG: GNAT family N-acetyltransferase [Malacoplasma sp.]|nr:GNAT family N-acetyltransferase [Malacoplasma sp.]